MLQLVFVEPCIPGNTGNAIRTAAATGTHLHLVEPLGFSMADSQLRRAGLDYHDLAVVTVHASMTALWDALGTARVYAFTSHARVAYTEIAYRDGDVLVFGGEPDGLPERVLTDPHVAERVRIPMLPGRRSLNLSNSAAIAMYEAWRQLGFAGT